jgi:hypothetical protein
VFKSLNTSSSHARLTIKQRPEKRLLTRGKLAIPTNSEQLSATSAPTETSSSLHKARCASNCGCRLVQKTNKALALINPHSVGWLAASAGKSNKITSRWRSRCMQSATPSVSSTITTWHFWRPLSLSGAHGNETH